MNTSHAEPSLPEMVSSESGFTLIEAVVALVVLMIVVVGVFAAFTFSTTLNTGNSRRSQALSLLQKEVELLRSAKFVDQAAGGADSYTPTDCNDPRRDLTGTPAGSPRMLICTAVDGAVYTIVTEIDDDPFTAGQQVDASKNLKEIRVTVSRPVRAGSWEAAFATRAIFRRVRAN